MDKNEVRRLRGKLMVAEADLKACKSILRTPEDLNPERLKCHVKHVMENGAEIMALLETQLTLNLDPQTDPLSNP